MSRSSKDLQFKAKADAIKPQIKAVMDAAGYKEGTVVAVLAHLLCDTFVDLVVSHLEEVKAVDDPRKFIVETLAERTADMANVCLTLYTDKTSH